MPPTDTNTYPDFIRALPEIDTSLKGVRGWLIQGATNQTVFFDIDPVGEVPPHSHCAQWGIVLEGEMRLTIGSDTRVYRRGDRYFIPAGAVHSATFLTRFQAIDYFDDPKRYTARTGPCSAP